jgi:hypothetical protein
MHLLCSYRYIDTCYIRGCNQTRYFYIFWDAFTLLDPTYLDFTPALLCGSKILFALLAFCPSCGIGLQTFVNWTSLNGTRVN